MTVKEKFEKSVKENNAYYKYVAGDTERLYIIYYDDDNPTAVIKHLSKGHINYDLCCLDGDSEILNIRTFEDLENALKAYRAFRPFFE